MSLKRYTIVSIFWTVIGFTVQVVMIDYFGFKALVIVPCYSGTRFFIRYFMEKKWVFKKDDIPNNQTN